MKRKIFNKKFLMSMACLLFVAIIPLCSINLYNYSVLLNTSSQQEVVDNTDENNSENSSGDSNNNTSSVDENISDDDDNVEKQDDNLWTSDIRQPARTSQGYSIGTAEELAWMATQTSLIYTYTLTANIDLSEHLWVPIDNFAGTFNGNGYTISGMRIIEKYIVDVNEVSYAQSIVGLFSSNSGNIKNIIVKGSIQADAAEGVSSSAYGTSDSAIWAGGIVGSMYGGSIENCASYVDIVVGSLGKDDGLGYYYAYLGGIVGYMAEGEISNCINFGDITLDGNNFEAKYPEVAIGGMVGFVTNSNMNIYNCVNYGNITSYLSDSCVGGIVGKAVGISNLAGVEGVYSIKYCLNYGLIHAGALIAEVGGIAGQLSYASYGNGKKYTYLGNCANLGWVEGPGNYKKGGNGWSEGELVGWIGGDGAVIENCYVDVLKANRHSYTNQSDKICPGIIGIYGSGVDGNLRYGPDNFIFNLDYSTLLSSYSDSSLGSTWTGINFYSDSMSNAYPTLSWFVKEMNIQIKVRNKDGSLSNYSNSGLRGFSISSAGFITTTISTNNIEYCSTITNNNLEKVFKYTNSNEYNVQIYETSGNGLGKLIVDNGEVVEFTYKLNYGTYDESFTDITIVLEKIPEPTLFANFNVWTGESFYTGGARFTDIEESSDGLSSVFVGVDGEQYTGGEININSTVYVVIFPKDNYEILGMYVHEDFETQEVDARIENYNDLTFEGVEGEEQARQRVSVEWASDFSYVIYIFRLVDLITSVEIVEGGGESGEGEVGGQALKDIGSVIFPGGSGGGSGDSGSGDSGEVTEEPEYTYNFTYASEFDIVLVPYRTEHTINVSYMNYSYQDNLYLFRGYEARAQYADHGSARSNNVFYSDGSSATMINLTGPYSNYFVNSDYVEYVAQISGAINSYWSTVDSSGIDSGIRGNIAFSFFSGKLNLVPSNLFDRDARAIEPYSIINITFKRCDSRSFNYTYTLYLTDAYQVYSENDSAAYLPGQVAGETYYYGSSQIAKENIDISLENDSTGNDSTINVSATKITMQATYREQFSIWHSSANILSSGFNGYIDTSDILSSSYQTIGGKSVNINSPLGSFITATEKNAIVGYSADDPFMFASKYNNTESPVNLKNTSLYNIMDRYGDLSINGDSVILYTFFNIRDDYDVTIKTTISGASVATEFLMPVGSEEKVFYVNGEPINDDSKALSCSPFDEISISVTDKLVYVYEGESKTRFYSFDSITIGKNVLSESDEFSFQMIPTNDVTEIEICINFKEEFVLESEDFNEEEGSEDGSAIDYNSSILYVDSTADLLNIAYRLYCQGLSLPKKIVQTADIDFNGDYMLPIGTDAMPFTSIYDGGYYRIENMELAGGNAVNIGLFGYAEGATIKNLTIMNSSVSGRGNVGMVVGYGDGVTLERVGVYNCSTTTMDSKEAGIGVFVVDLNNNTAEILKESNEYTNCTLNNINYTILSEMIADDIDNIADESGHAGDLVGNIENNSTIYICFVRKSQTGKFSTGNSSTNNSSIGGIAGNVSNSKISYSYTSRSTIAITTNSSSECTHADVTDISATCSECADLFIW